MAGKIVILDIGPLGLLGRAGGEEH
jgi:hypothetical protein